MAWTVSFKKEFYKFIDKQSPDTQDRVRHSLNALLDYLNKDVFPFSEMDIKKLHSKRKGFYRLRVGNIRILIRFDLSSKVLRVYDIDYRGGVYK